MNAEDFPGLADALGHQLSWRAKLKERWVIFRPRLLSEPGLLAVLAAGLAIGGAAAIARSGEAKRDLAGTERARSAGESFDILLPRGWENLSAEANFGAPPAEKRELVLRQKARSGSRLLVIHKYNPGKNGPKSIDLLGSWMVGQKQELAQLRQQTASLLPAAAASAKGVPVELFRLAGPAAETPGAEMSAGTFVFKGDFYEFSYATSYPRDEELLLALLGSIRSIQGSKKSDEKEPAKPPVKKPSKKPAKRARGNDRARHPQ